MLAWPRRVSFEHHGELFGAALPALEGFQHDRSIRHISTTNAAGFRDVPWSSLAIQVEGVRMPTDGRIEEAGLRRRAAALLIDAVLASAISLSVVVALHAAGVAPRSAVVNNVVAALAAPAYFIPQWHGVRPSQCA
jgi:hypothetical protein